MKALPAKNPDGYKHALFNVISDAAADRRIGVSVALDVLVDVEGWLGLYDSLDTRLFDLLDESGDLANLARAIIDAVYNVPDIDRIAPFDGTIRDNLEDGETEYDWVLNQDILPFLERWRDLILGYEPKEWAP